MRALIMIFVLTCAPGELLFGWGAEGHRAVGTLAQDLISSETQVKVQQLLHQSGDSDLATVRIFPTTREPVTTMRQPTGERATGSCRRIDLTR